MTTKKVSNKITNVLTKHIPNNKFKCVYINEEFVGLSVNIDNAYIIENKNIINKILKECDKSYGTYINSYDFITKTLFNIYFHDENIIRNKKISKIKYKLLSN